MNLRVAFWPGYYEQDQDGTTARDACERNALCILLVCLWIGLRERNYRKKVLYAWVWYVNTTNFRGLRAYAMYVRGIRIGLVCVQCRNRGVCKCLSLHLTQYMWAGWDCVIAYCRRCFYLYLVLVVFHDDIPLITLGVNVCECVYATSLLPKYFLAEFICGIVYNRSMQWFARMRVYAWMYVRRPYKSHCSSAI